jgi:phosphatidylinositol glycan class B
VIVCDRFLWLIGKQTVGKNATRVAFLFLIISRIYNEIITRCFSNSIETIFQTIAFYYFLQVKNRFDFNVVMLTALLTVSFMIRNTSPIGWPPILLMKIIKDRSLIPLLFAGAFVFVPTVALCVLVDSYYYGMKDFPVVTAYNFVCANLAEGLSKYFGTEPPHFYLLAVMPLIFTVAYPASLVAPITYARDALRSKGQPPYMAVFSGFYFLLFSLIAHKEPRFLLPIVPLIFLMVGYLLAKLTKRSSPRVRTLLRLYMWLAIAVEVAMTVFFLFM